MSTTFYIDRSDRGRLRLTGRDRQTFLQGMITNDVVRLTPGQGCYAFLLDATGHVLSDARVLCMEDSLLLDVEPGQAEFVKTTLEKYLIMERCRITDVTGETGQLTVWGTDALPAIQQAIDVSLPADAGDYSTVAAEFNGQAVTIALSHLAPVPVVDIYFADPQTQTVGIQAALEAHGIAAGDAALLNAYRVEAGIPRFGVDMDARVLGPETAQQKRAISYRKGCYIGQEIVARIDARGHTNRTLAGFYLPEGQPLPAPDTALVSDEGREVGRVTSSAIGPTVQKPIALGYIRHEFATPGTRLKLAGSETLVEVAALPFTKGVETPGVNEAKTGGAV